VGKSSGSVMLLLLDDMALEETVLEETALEELGVAEETVLLDDVELDPELPPHAYKHMASARRKLRKYKDIKLSTIVILIFSVNNGIYGYSKDSLVARYISMINK
jgi:hypothetical protein